MSTIMKTKLFYLFLFATTFLFAQLPSDYVARYDFIGGSLENNATAGQSGNLSGTISSNQYINDRFGRVNDALTINKDQLAGYSFTGTKNDVSVSFWWKGTGVASGNNQRIFQIFDGSGDGMTMRIATSNTLIARFKNNGTDHQSSQASLPIFDGNWHHIVFTISKTGSGYDNSVYLDGALHTVLSQNVDSNNTQNFLSSTAQFIISASGVGFTGDIDDFQLYSRTITASEVTDIYNYTAPAPYTTAYVNRAATGNNDGSSWNDAFLDLQSALKYSRNNLSEIWIAEGVYKPGSDRNDTYNINLDNISLYGGFDGTETSINDRNINDHPTILSGDLLGNDVASTVFLHSTKNDNSYHVVTFAANDITLNGITIEKGNANQGTTTVNSYGSAILVNPTTNGFTLKNCKIQNNIGVSGGALRTYYSVTANVNIENTIFDSNISRYGSGLYLLVNNFRSVTLKITNSLFTNNISENYTSSNTGFTGSSIWARANGTNSNLTTDISNCTFANNIDRGTQAASDRGTLALSRRTDGASVHNVSLNNSIIYSNTDANNAASLDISVGHVSLPNQVIIFNSIGESNFSNISTSTISGASTVDPLFTDASNNDFTLSASSPAIDSGENSRIPTGIVSDLLGKNRIHNGTVDMGAYEFGASPLSVDDSFKILNEISLYPNPVKNNVHVSSTDEVEKIEVYNLLGKKLVEKRKSDFIDLSHLSTNVFIIKVYTKEKVYSKKLMKE